MTAEDSEEWNISVCGLNCSRCDIRRASLGDERLMDEIVEWFKEKSETVIESEQIRCDSCRGPLESHWSPDCEMMKCAKERGYVHCFKCGDFPCEKLEEFSRNGVAHHARTVNNLKRMREIGLNNWIKEEESRGRCVFCP